MPAEQVLFTPGFFLNMGILVPLPKADYGHVAPIQRRDNECGQEHCLYLLSSELGRGSIKSREARTSAGGCKCTIVGVNGLERCENRLEGPLQCCKTPRQHL